MDEMLKKIKEHEAYVSKVSFTRTSQLGLSNTVARSFADLTAELRVWLAFTLGYQKYRRFVLQVRSNQENRLKPYFAELEVNIKVGIEN